MRKITLFFNCFVYGLILMFRTGLAEKFLYNKNFDVDYNKAIKCESKIYLDVSILYFVMCIVYIFIYSYLDSIQLKAILIALSIIISYFAAVLIFAFKMYRSISTRETRDA